MNTKKNYLALFVWVISFVLIGFSIGLLTKPEINTWYKALYLPPLTPPHYVFPITWTILYALLGFVGWSIWASKKLMQSTIIKSLFVVQLILNWSWSPLFFLLHSIDSALLVLVIMDLCIVVLSWLIWMQNRLIAVWLAIYLLWILFATYLNTYIWLYN